MKSPSFSSFRQLLDQWDEVSPQFKVKVLLEDNSLVLFFKKGKTIYGAPESSRLVFAKLKNPDEDTPDGWADEASFVAYDLGKAVHGDKVQVMFTNKDLDDLKVMDQKQVEKALAKQGGKGTEIVNIDDEEDHPTSPENQPTVYKVDEL